MKNISWGSIVRRWKNECAARVFLTPYDASEWDIFHIKNNQLIILFIIYLINIIIFDFSFESRNEKRKVVPKLRQEVKVDIVTSDDIKVYYTGRFQDFPARYMIKIDVSDKRYQTSLKKCYSARKARLEFKDSWSKDCQRQFRIPPEPLRCLLCTKFLCHYFSMVCFPQRKMTIL